MKVVACKKCGAKYQIDDNETVDGYECSACAGSLEEVESYPLVSSTMNKRKADDLNSQKADSQIAYCKDCGLKYRLETGENIDDYECSSCYGELRYADDKINRIIEERKLIQKELSKNIPANNPNKENIQSKNKNTRPTLERKENIPQDRDESKIKTVKTETKKKNLQKTKTTKKNLNNNKTNENDLKSIEDSLRNQVKNEFSDSLDNSYGDKSRAKTSKEKDEVKSNKKDLVPDPNITNRSYHDVYIIAGLIVALIGFADVLFSQREYSIFFIAIGFILFGIGLYKIRTHKATEVRGKIIRDRLLTLPERFYVLYYVKVPGSSDGINHVVVGPSGIFSIVSQSFGEKEDKEKLKTDIESKRMIANSKLDDLILAGTDPEDEANQTKKEDKEEKEVKENKKSRFKYTTKELKFDHNGKIKQKAINLSENLVTFLNENGFEDSYTEPLVGFVNKEVAVINNPLTDDDLFLDELLFRIIHGKQKLDDITTHRVAVLLSQYATECSS